MTAEQEHEQRLLATVCIAVVVVASLICGQNVTKHVVKKGIISRPTAVATPQQSRC